MSDLLKYMAENLTEKDIENVRLSAQLLPCPFCGSDDVEVVEPYEPYRFGRGYIVNCNICCGSSWNHETAEEAIKAWNRRASDERD